MGILTKFFKVQNNETKIVHQLSKEEIMKKSTSIIVNQLHNEESIIPIWMDDDRLFQMDQRRHEKKMILAHRKIIQENPSDPTNHVVDTLTSYGIDRNKVLLLCIGAMEESLLNNHSDFLQKEIPDFYDELSEKNPNGSIAQLFKLCNEYLRQSVNPDQTLLHSVIKMLSGRH